MLSGTEVRPLELLEFAIREKFREFCFEACVVGGGKTHHPHATIPSYVVVSLVRERVVRGNRRIDRVKGSHFSSGRFIRYGQARQPNNVVLGWVPTRLSAEGQPLIDLIAENLARYRIRALNTFWCLLKSKSLTQL